MKAKIAFLHGPRDLRVEEVDVPQLKPNQVLIKVGACGICGSDVECFEGKSGEGRYDLGPYTPGHEWGGEIADIGSDVTTLKPGYKVTGDCVMHCGVCRNCQNGLMPSACLPVWLSRRTYSRGLAKGVVRSSSVLVAFPLAFFSVSSFLLLSFAASSRFLGPWCFFLFPDVGVLSFLGVGVLSYL